LINTYYFFEKWSIFFLKPGTVQFGINVNSAYHYHCKSVPKLQYRPHFSPYKYVILFYQKLLMWKTQRDRLDLPNKHSRYVYFKAFWQRSCQLPRLYSIGNGWINEYGEFVEWYWQGKTDLLRTRPSRCPSLHRNSQINRPISTKHITNTSYSWYSTCLNCPRINKGQYSQYDVLNMQRENIAKNKQQLFFSYLLANYSIFR
jgi:hypothetical protein